MITQVRQVLLSKIDVNYVRLGIAKSENPLNVWKKQEVKNIKHTLLGSDFKH